MQVITDAATRQTEEETRAGQNIPASSVDKTSEK